MCIIGVSLAQKMYGKSALPKVETTSLRRVLIPYEARLQVKMNFFLNLSQNKRFAESLYCDDGCASLLFLYVG